MPEVAIIDSSCVLCGFLVGGPYKLSYYLVVTDVQAPYYKHEIGLSDTVWLSYTSHLKVMALAADKKASLRVIRFSILWRLTQ